MASSQVAPSPATSRKDHLEAGRRRLEEFRKKKAEERAKKASSSSSNEQSHLSGLKNNQTEQLSAGSPSAHAHVLNGSTPEKNPGRDSNSSLVPPSPYTTSALHIPVVPSNEVGSPEIFVKENVKVKVSVAEPINTETATLSNVSGEIYNSGLQSSHKDTRESKRQEVASSIESGSGYVNSSRISSSENISGVAKKQEPHINSWRRSSSENISELTKKHETKIAGSESTKVEIEPSNSHPHIPEYGWPITKDGYFLPQEENLRGIVIPEMNGSMNDLVNKLPAEAQVSSNFFSRDAQENVQYSKISQPPARSSLSLFADEAVTKSQMDTRNGSQMSSLTEPTFSSKQFSNEPMDFSNGTLGKGAKDLFEGRKFQFSDSSSNNQSQNQDSVGVQFYSNSRFRPSPTLFSADKSSFSSRSRPSFLDSITPSTRSPTLQTAVPGPEKSSENSNNAEVGSIVEMSYDKRGGFEKIGMNDRVLGQFELSSSQKNDDFSALEQHIEDLTQEKFSLQRALDASRTLAESLAQENSSLTDAFNQQGAVVNQLKTDLEKKREEIRAQLLALNTLKMESDNAQLECSAADERAKMLASEVISLEEKALRLRSNELKLERQLETLNGELASTRRHSSSLEKERADLRSTIDALQEEKKLLQSKLRKTAANDSFDVRSTSKNSRDLKDACTSTEDIGIEVLNFPAMGGLFLARQDDVPTRIPTTQAFLQPINVQEVSDVQSGGATSSTSFNLSSFTEVTNSLNSDQRTHLLDLPTGIPSDQQRMVDNINSLIEELALEKESLARALRTESAEASMLRASNREFSQKLEVQTQRLELLISQNMAHEGRLVGPRNFDNMHEEIEYVDEGDEVVERVLGWIMKLFPGGSSKRRTSKLL
jgi:hypothetical protein